MWGSHGPTTNVYIAKMTDCPCLSCCSPIRCHGPPLQSNGAPTLPKCTRKDHIFTTRSSYACVRLTTGLYGRVAHRSAGRNISVFIQYKLVGPITCKPKHQDSSCFPLFILCTRIMKIFVFCWCVHIAYVSIWCPVDIVWIWISLISVGFILHVGWERRERGQGVFVFYSGCSLGDLFIHFLALKVHKCRCIA